MEVVRYKEKYLVSDKGDIFKENKKYTIKKKQATNKYGYKVTKINGKQERVHRIVKSEAPQVTHCIKFTL